MPMQHHTYSRLDSWGTFWTGVSATAINLSSKTWTYVVHFETRKNCYIFGNSNIPVLIWHHIKMFQINLVELTQLLAWMPWRVSKLLHWSPYFYDSHNRNSTSTILQCFQIGMFTLGILHFFLSTVLFSSTGLAKYWCSFNSFCHYFRSVVLMFVGLTTQLLPPESTPC